MLRHTAPSTALLLVPLLALSGCTDPQTLDFPRLASAFKFVGCCSVLCALIWATAIVISSNNRRKGG